MKRSCAVGNDEIAVEAWTCLGQFIVETIQHNITAQRHLQNMGDGGRQKDLDEREIRESQFGCMLERSTTDTKV